jgi:hypothetical protein
MFQLVVLLRPSYTHRLSSRTNLYNIGHKLSKEADNVGGHMMQRDRCCNLPPDEIYR